MIRLSQSQRNELHEFMLSMFNTRSLKLHTRLRLGLSLEMVVNVNQADETLFLDVLEYLDRHGTLEAFLRESLQAFPDRDDFQAYCKREFPEILQPVSTSKLVQSLGDAVATVTNSMNSPKVRVTIGGFLADFQTIDKRITQLSSYKKLHELIHILQQQLPSLRHAAKSFPQDLDAKIQLSPARMRLDAHVISARDYCADLPTKQYEQLWIGDLERAAQIAEQGWNDESSDLMNQALERIRILFRELPRINGQLTVVLDDLPLKRLLEALSKVAEQNQETERADDPSYNRLLEGKNALARIQPALYGLANQHTDWQLLDHELAGIEFNPGIRPSDRIVHWEHVNSSLLEMCDTFKNDQWAIQIRSHITNWQQFSETWETEPSPALEDKCEIEADSLRARASLRFFQIDADLRTMCEELVQIGAPINSLLEEYAHGN